jgi:hypothetical protein
MINTNPIQFENPFTKARLKMQDPLGPSPPHAYPHPSLESMMRTIKIRVIENGFVQQDRHGDIPNTIKFLAKEMSSDDILTGSLALILFFEMDGRVFGDIDIISKNPQRWGKLMKTSYPDEPQNYIGTTYKIYKSGFFKKRKEYKVDIFNFPCDYITYDIGSSKIKVHNPISILEAKLRIYSEDHYSSTNHKHYWDIYNIYNKLN